MTQQEHQAAALLDGFHHGGALYGWQPDVQCYVARIELLDELTVRLRVGPYSCTDMAGAIRLAKRFMPAVRRIVVEAEAAERHPTYVRNGRGKWLVIADDQAHPLHDPARFPAELLRPGELPARTQASATIGAGVH